MSVQFSISPSVPEISFPSACGTNSTKINSGSIEMKIVKIIILLCLLNLFF
jgi:hypothetical protein